MTPIQKRKLFTLVRNATDAAGREALVEWIDVYAEFTADELLRVELAKREPRRFAWFWNLIGRAP